MEANDQGIGMNVKGSRSTGTEEVSTRRQIEAPKERDLLAGRGQSKEDVVLSEVWE